MLITEEWDRRFTQQAKWTHNLRLYIYDRVGIKQLNHIIEIGCGTGAVLADFHDARDKIIFGLDIAENFIRIAQQKNPCAYLSIGDALTLPFKESSFDAIFCHFFLLWVNDPTIALREMCRIARKDAKIIVFAEPDYGGRVDYPDELVKLGQAQTASLMNQGADPFIGRRLGNICKNAGITLVEMGVLGGQWTPHTKTEVEDNDEWQMLLYDIDKHPEDNTNPLLETSEVDKLRNIHRNAMISGERVFFIPTFYAWGIVNK